MRIKIKYKKLVLILIASAMPLYIFFLKLHHPPNLNVILITCDSLRPDHLGCYGYNLNTSPNIDKLAKEATLFTQAITQGTKTCLALPSLLTSTYPRTHGCYREGFKMNSSLPTLAQILKKYKYSTAAIIDSIPRIPGLEKGFDSFAHYTVNKADEITNSAIALLKKNRRRKFFLWIHYFDPHGPYRPPSPYNRMFIGNPKVLQRHVPICAKMHSCYKSIPLSVAENNITDVDYYISQYDGEIRFTDKQIGVLLEEVKKLNLDRKSIVVLTADHGELLGEHGFYFGHSQLYEQTLKVPLLVKCEKIIPASKIIKEQVRSIDIVPTILALLHIPKDTHMQGENLLPLVFGAPNNALYYAFSEMARSKESELHECVRTPEWKLVYQKYGDDGWYKLYNLDRDPEEANNLINAERDKFESLKKKLEAWRRETPISSPEPFPLTEADKNTLRTLGYLQ